MPSIARTASATLCHFGCEADDMMTGTQTSGANGLARPPVMNRSAVSCARSMPSRAKAAGGSQPVRRRIADRQVGIDPGKERDQRAAGDQRQRELQPESDDENRDRLAADRQPAQPHDRLQPQASGWWSGHPPSIAAAVHIRVSLIGSV